MDEFFVKVYKEFVRDAIIGDKFDSVFNKRAETRDYEEDNDTDNEELFEKSSGTRGVRRVTEACFDCLTLLALIA